MMSRDLGAMPRVNYAEARSTTLSSHETSVDFVRSDRVGNVIASAGNGWLAGGEVLHYYTVVE
jgi:hypothetical protein